MNAKAGFTLSLDCEGLWGMADQAAVLGSGRINQEALAETYGFLDRVLDSNDIRATAAFVTCFAAGRDLLQEHLDYLRELAAVEPGWFAHLLPALDDGEWDGWRGDTFYQLLARGGHEMGWHGTTHLSLHEHTPVDVVELELELGLRLLAALGSQPQSIVFPRNQVGHLQRLKAAGFRTYRAAPSATLLGRAAALAAEWNVFGRNVRAKPVCRGGWQILPAGHFLNWPSGPRRLVPVQVTVMRWRSLLRAALEAGGYVHMWFHPHNLITAPAMRTAFEAIMGEVAGLCQSGDMEVLTMAESVQLLSGRNGESAA